jgi:copper(I)-binding protein
MICRLSVACVVVALFLAPVTAGAHEFKIGALTIEHPYGPDTPPNARTAVAYMTIRNDGDTPDRLLRAISARADSVELHTTVRDGDVMRMRDVDAIDIPPHKSVTFAPAGLHAMLVGLKGAFAVGQTVPMTLVFEKAGTVEIGVLVQKPGRGDSDHATHQH